MSARDPDRLVESWARGSRPATSDHAAMEAAYAHRRGDQAGAEPPLEDGAPVPGCTCERCTGIPPRRRRRKKRRRPRRDLRPALDVDAARAAPVLDVARGLGLGEPQRRGGEHVAHCPLHDDTKPSMRLNADKGVWYCDPCGEGGSVIDLVMAAQGVGFVDAVRYLTGR